MTETLKPQSTVTQGTAIAGAFGSAASVTISAEAVLWALPDAYADMPVTLAATIGTIGAGAIGVIIALVYWGLSLLPGVGNPFKSRPIFPTEDNAK